ncbi:hypothetical protein BDM02DRAFT_3119578 [Thelephora ganbajun]|uniref:Uncharacterized protein n=1 Tax=Thelephora ganbajun TaxID=370292 RepID=A0ACB6Z864_THEGA|nr:hypothetical protein BDM02DRAFT_3119578 [Thelephora ganbajun]
MPTRYDNSEAGSNSSFLSPHPHSQAPRRIPSKQNLTLNGRRSNASLHANSLAQVMDDSASPSSAKHSLAHELAVALLPEPSKNSKLFAEEFGLEFDEGAEGIDESVSYDSGYERHDHHEESDGRMKLGDELGQLPLVLEPGEDPALYDPEAFSVHATNGIADDLDPSFDSPGPPASPIRRKHRDRGGREREREREQDAMKILSQDLEYTEKFLFQLQHLDAESSTNPHSSHLSLEQIASNMISRINETARDREQQVRELLMYEREFKKIAGEHGGDDVLSQLDELERVEGLILSEPERPPLPQANSLVTNKPSHARQNSVNSINHSPRLSREWDPRSQSSYDDEDQLYSDSDQPTPSKDTFSIPPPPPIIDPLTPAQTIPQLSHLQTYTSTLVASLTNISEQVQVNGAATSEAGRKIRALKNKLGGWRTDWDSAERSRQKVEKWEAERKVASLSSFSASASLATIRNKNIDGRLVVEEHLRESQRALDEATARIRIIMAAS